MAHEHVLLSKERYERLLKNAATLKSSTGLKSNKKNLQNEHPKNEKDEMKAEKLTDDEKSSGVTNNISQQTLKRSSTEKPETKVPKRKKNTTVTSTGSAGYRSRDNVLDLPYNDRPSVSTYDEPDISPMVPGMPKKEFERHFSNGRSTSFKKNMSGLLNGLKKRELAVIQKNKTGRTKNKEIAKNWINF